MCSLRPMSTPMWIIDSQNICRACLSVSASEHMFNKSSELAHLYTECTNLKVTDTDGNITCMKCLNEYTLAAPGDGLSEYICGECCAKLSNFFEFRKNCIDAYNTLRKDREDPLELDYTGCSDNIRDNHNHNKVFTSPSDKFEITIEGSAYLEREYSQSEGSLDKLINEISNSDDNENDDDQRATSTEMCNPDKITDQFDQNYQKTFLATNDLENYIKIEKCTSEINGTRDIFEEKFKVGKNLRKHKTNEKKINAYYTQEHKDIFDKSFSLLSNIYDYLKVHITTTANEKDTTINCIPSDIVCPICEVGFLDLNTFKEHLQNHSFAEIAFQYSKIKKESNKLMKQPKNNLKDHNTTKDIKCAQLKMVCAVCKVKFQDRKTFREHLKSHNINGKTFLKLKIKTKRESNILRMKQSIKQLKKRNVNAKISLKCQICNSVMKDRETLREHKKISHGADHTAASTKIRETDICHICGKTVRSNFRVHVLVCANEKKLSCKVCGKRFNHIGRLRAHEVLHKEKKYICDHCGKRFHKKREVWQHLNTHIGWRISCAMCSKTFSSHSMLAIHRRIHTGERPYRCDVCEKDFTCKNFLTKHKTTHSSERPHQCQYCGNKYKVKNSLRRHLKTQCKTQASN